MITNEGKAVIKNFFGQQTSQIGGSIAVGVGTTAASLGDTKLAFEVARIPVSSVAPDLTNNRIVFKGLLPVSSIGVIYEAGLYSDTPLGTDQTLVLSDNLPSQWTNATLTSNNARTSLNTVLVTAAASATTNAELTSLNNNVSSFAQSDSFAVAFFSDSNLSSVSVRVGNSATIYREFIFSSPAAGYNTLRKTLSQGTDVGVVDFTKISYVALRPTAKSTGTTNLFFDGMRFENSSTPNNLVARVILASPQVTDTSIPTEIEYSLGITV